MLDMRYEQHDEPPVPEDKTKIREEIRQAVEQYLSHGGIITVIERYRSGYDSVTNRPNEMTDRQKTLLKSLRTGSKNGIASARSNKRRGGR